MRSVVVFCSRNSISAAPNISFTPLNDNTKEAALRFVRISRVVLTQSGPAGAKLSPWPFLPRSLLE
jgi:hypothetical protein